MKQQGSNFVSWGGIIFLAILVLLAAYFDVASLEIFLVVVFILCLAAFAWGRFALRKVEVEIEEEECCGFPGQVLEVDAQLHNRKVLPLIWLDLGFTIGTKTCIVPPAEATGKHSEPKQEKQRELRAAFIWVMPHQKVSWKQSALAVHRGICRMDTVNLCSGDGFGLSSQTGTMTLPAPVRFVVYPKIIPVDVALILNNMSEMENAKNGFYTDRTLLENTRDYREGDSFKNINWRLLARRDDVQVNVYEKLTMHRVCFIPDMFSFTHLEDIEEGQEKRRVRVLETECMEDMFSLMASVIVKLHEHGVICSLVVPACGDKPEKVVIPESAETQVMELLGALAEIEYECENMSMPADTLTFERHKLGQIYLFSKNLQRSMLTSGHCAIQELGIISVLQDASGLMSGEKNILSEMDFKTI